MRPDGTTTRYAMLLGHTLAALGVFFLLLVLGAPSARADTIEYHFEMDAPNGYPVTHLVMYAANASEDDLYLVPGQLAATGTFTLTQSVGFIPTRALVLGITERDKDDSWDIVVFTNPAFVWDNIGTRFDALFPADRNPRHSEVGPLLQDAHLADATALSELTGFLRGSDAAAAQFDPYGAYVISQFTVLQPPNGGPVPEPGTMALLGLSLLGFAIVRRRSRDTGSTS